MCVCVYTLLYQRTTLGVILQVLFTLYLDRICHWPGASQGGLTSYTVNPRTLPVSACQVLDTMASFLCVSRGIKVRCSPLHGKNITSPAFSLLPPPFKFCLSSNGTHVFLCSIFMHRVILLCLIPLSPSCWFLIPGLLSSAVTFHVDLSFSSSLLP